MESYRFAFRSASQRPSSSQVKYSLASFLPVFLYSARRIVALGGSTGLCLLAYDRGFRLPRLGDWRYEVFWPLPSAVWQYRSWSRFARTADLGLAERAS